MVKFSIYLNRRVFVMFYPYLFLISPSFCASGVFGFVIVAFSGYLHLYFCITGDFDIIVQFYYLHIVKNLKFNELI